ncbi:hypothetical protein [Lentibacillus sp. Marseille-P4043]|uniref:hypothetical protein n=1 Tax=Lentibacillus sp. Marseille-P4043 TaxID=2040293 RepID=UPI000D0AEB74|nr:hypothetical protein [Lentibacillus sp. Marseille-P4043]
MEKLLDCSNLESTYKSVADILGVQISTVGKFILNNTYRFEINKYGSLEYKNRLDVDDLANSFNVAEEKIDFDYLTVQHVASIYDRNSLLTNGLMNIKDLFTSDNAFRSKLKEYGLDTGTTANGEPYIEREGQIVSTDYLQHRFNRDRCINGFLTWIDAQTDSNVSNIRECPEIVSHIGRYILDSYALEKDWIRNSESSVISFKVALEEILDINHIPVTKQHLLLSAIDCLLKFHVGYKDYKTIMIFLKENISIDASRIIDIRSFS